MLLRALTIIFVVVGLVFVTWSMLVMTGGRDWLAEALTTAPKVAEAPPPKPEAPPPSPPKEATPPEEAEPVDAAEHAPAEGQGVDPAGNPLETAKAAEPGTLINPYQDDYDAVAKDGHKKYMSAGCNGCHGGTGGGGMAPPLTNPVWVYGNDGDTMFRLIALGTKGLEEQGYSRQRSEIVKGPMPPFGTIIKSNDDLWKMIAWIWSVNTHNKPGEKAYPKAGGP